MDFKCFFDSLAVFGDRSWPDAAFVVEKGAEKDSDGRTLQKFRHLVHHTKNATDPMAHGTVDLPHLRNALARVNQVKPIKESAANFRKRAKSHLQRHAKAVLESYKSKSSLTSEERGFVEFCRQLGD
jgi:hypothetical protein